MTFTSRRGPRHPPPSAASLDIDADFRSLADSLHHLLWITAVDGSTAFVNRGVTEFRGEASSARDWSDLLHPDDSDGARAAWEFSQSAGKPYEFAARLRRFDGEYLWHTLRAETVRSDDGRVVMWVGTATDIDRATRTEVAGRSAQPATAETLALLETLQLKAPVGFGFVDRQFRIVRLNERLAAITGSTVAEQLGRSVAEVAPQLWPQLEPLYRSVLDTGEAVMDLETDDRPVTDPDTVRHWRSSLYPVLVNGEVVGVGVVVVDMTELRQVDEMRTRLSAIVEASGAAIFGTTVDGRTTSCNEAAERLFGYSAAELLDRPISVLSPPGRISRRADIRDRISAGGPAEHHESVFQCKDGALLDVITTSSPATDAAGKIIGLSLIVQDITERRNAERGLEASERRLAEAQRIAQLGSYEHNLVNGEMTWSVELYRILGADPNVAASGDYYFTMVHPEDRSLVAQKYADLTRWGTVFDLEYRIRRPDGAQRWVLGRGVAERAGDSTILTLVGTVADITDRVEADRVRREAEAGFENIFEQSGIGAAIIGLDGVLLRVNAALGSLLGRSEDELVGRGRDEFLHPEEEPIATRAAEWLDDGHDTHTDETRYLRPDGSEVWASVHTTRVRDDAGRPLHYLGQFQDITERKQMAQELAHHALHDSLTGLPNRTLLTDRLVHGLAGTRRRHAQLGVIFLDLDHFKVVNDSLGHSAGDALLQEVAARITAAIRPSDTVARFGGDEFVIVCDDAQIVETEQIAGRVLAAMGQPFTAGGRGADGDRQHGHRRLIGGSHPGEPAARLRCRDVPGQEPGAGAGGALRRAAAPDRRASNGDGVGATSCSRAARAQRRLPADRGPRKR